MREKSIKKVINTKKGITLIALVITIIVMLILVAVTINMAVNGGLFGYAGNAVRDTKTAKQDELKIAEGSLEVDKKKYNLIDEYINAKPDYAKSLLNSDGVLTKNAIYVDSNNEAAEIPKGFKLSDVTTEQKISDGLVIQDKEGNEFVWIPVKFINDNTDNGFEKVFYRSSWSNNARGTTNYTEGTTYLESESNDPTGEYTKMMLSVKKNKGFYIGRYEAGVPTIENPRLERSSNPGTSIMVIKRDCFPYNWVGWGSSMTDYTNDVKLSWETNSLGKGAVYLSKNMYPEDSQDYGARSTLCYGVQWDAMLDFIIKNDNNVHNLNQSTTWGNYKDNGWTINRTEVSYSEDNGKTWTKISDVTNQKIVKNSSTSILLTTGASDKFKVKNIYDVAGNVAEWTMESRNENTRVFRGGSFINNGSTGFPAYSRNSNGPTFVLQSTNGLDIGFRVALYII